MLCHGLTTWQRDAGSGGWVWHPSTHRPVLGGEGPQVTVGGCPSLFSPAPLQGRHHLLALVPWPGLPALPLFLVSGFTSAPRIEEPTIVVGAEPGKLRREKEGGRVASKCLPSLGAIGDPLHMVSAA